MRAGLLQSWPALSHFFGLHPWDVGRLSPLELAEYLTAAEDLSKGA